MADAPAADGNNDAQEDNKNKLKKKKNEPEKKEKLVIHGRKDEDILGSAYVKKYRRDDPTDWSRYADNPRGMLNRRRLTREERRRQFTVQNVVGDPRETAHRNFDALFEESDNRLTKPKTVTEAFRLRVLRVCGGRWWDRMYLFNLGWVLVCAEIKQRVGCTSFLGDGAAVLAPSSGEERAPSRYRAGVAPMAWGSTRRFRTNAVKF